MLNIFNKLSNKKILLISGLLILLMVGVVLLFTFNVITETVFTIIFFILIILFTSLTSTLIQRRIQKRMEDKKKGKMYSYSSELAFDKPLKSLKANYGNVDLYLENKTLYVLITVNDAQIFFSEEQQQVKYNVDTKKYDNLIQFYIFDNKDYEYFRKISIVNYQADKFYVGSFIKDEENKTIYQSDNVKRNELYESIYNKFLKLINVNEDQD